MTDHPTLTDGDPEARNVGAWSLDDILETAETLAVWHEDQHAAAMRRCDSSAVVEHGVAADLIRELMDRVPPPRTCSNRACSRAATRVYLTQRVIHGAPKTVHYARCDRHPLQGRESRPIEACERAHERPKP